MRECMKCNSWNYDERIAKHYGEGTGLCEETKEPKGCNRAACLLFEEKNEEEK